MRRVSVGRATITYLYELKVTHADLWLAFQDRKDTSIPKSSFLAVFVVIEITSLSVVDEVQIFLGKLGNLAAFASDLEFSCCAREAV